MSYGWIRAPWSGGLAAVAATVLAALAGLAVSPTVPHQWFYLSVLLVAATWGQRAGAWAVLGGALAGGFLQGQIASAPHLASLLLFVVVGLGIAVQAGRARTIQQRAAQQTELLAVTLASLGEAVVATNPQDQIAFFNAEAERLTGWQQAEALGQPLRTVFQVCTAAKRSPGTEAETPRPSWPWVNGQRERRVLLARDGREIPIEGRRAPLRSSDESVSGTVLIFRDYSEQKKAEEALREAAESRRMGLDAAELGTWDYDPQRLILYWDDRCRAIFEYPHDQLPLAEFGSLIHPEDRPQWARILGASLDPTSDGRCVVECRIILRDGTIRWCAAKGQTYFEGEGADRRAVRMVGTVMDVTTQKEAEVALAQQKEAAEAHQRRLQAVLDALPVAVYIADAQGRILAANPAAETIWGCQALLSESVAHYRDDYHAWWPETGRRVESHEWGLARALRTGEHCLAEELEIAAADGQRKTILNYAIPIRNAQGAITGAVAVNVDITERRRAQQELRRAKAAAESANQAKSQFLANMSHELRTPLNSILGMTELALQEPLPSSVRDYLQTAKDSADALLALINEVLDLSRIEAGMLELEARPFTLRSLLDDTARAMALRAFEKGLELVCDVDPDVPDELIGDPLRLRQILTNLLGNAIKFTAQGEIVVRVTGGGSAADHASPEASDVVVLEFSVADTGIGIPPEQRERIFEPFAQADPSTTRHYGGSGLGLSIVARLVAMLDGCLWLQSEVGQGSTFFFTVRLRRQTSSPSPDPRRHLWERLAGRAALVADAHPVNRSLLEEVLSRWGMRPVLAADGLAALGHLGAAAEDGGFAVALLDARLGGREETPPIRTLCREVGRHVPVVLMVAPTEKQRVLRELGEQDGVTFLEKPLSPGVVAEALAQALGVATGLPRAEAVACRPPGSAVRPLRILLVEDTPTNQKLAVHILSRRGHTVVVAPNGHEALDRLREGPFDVVLMDVQMPVMDGFQATQAIRRLPQPEKAAIPVIAMTAHALKGDEERCLNAGMDAYLSKPIEGKQLVALVERLAGSRSAELPGDPQEPHSEESLPSQEPESCAMPPFQLEEAIRSCYGSYELFQEMVSCFLAEGDPLVAQMRAALGENDREEVYRAAHRLKNTVVYLGARSATEAVRHVEQLTRSAEGPVVERAIEELSEQLASLKAALAEHRPSAC